LIGRLLTLLLGLGTVACSSVPAASAGGAGNSAPPASGASNAAAQQGVDNKGITIGLASILSGPSASASAISEATKATWIP
jgi:hypothetical protein